MPPQLIQIQIASVLSEEGVGDIRWVLLDPSDGDDAPMLPVPPAGLVPVACAMPVAVTPSQAAGSAPEAATDAPPNPQDEHHAAWTYQVLRAVIVVAALTLAWWVAGSLLEHRVAPPTGPQADNRSTR